MVLIPPSLVIFYPYQKHFLWSCAGGGCVGGDKQWVQQTQLLFSMEQRIVFKLGMIKTQEDCAKFQKYHWVFGERAAGSFVIHSLLVSTWRPPRVLSTWSQGEIHFKTHAFVSEFSFRVSKTHLLIRPSFPSRPAGSGPLDPGPRACCSFSRADGTGFLNYCPCHIRWSCPTKCGAAARMCSLQV